MSNPYLQVVITCGAQCEQKVEASKAATSGWWLINRYVHDDDSPPQVTIHAFRYEMMMDDSHPVCGLDCAHKVISSLLTQ